jgi:hypothetical protein
MIAKEVKALLDTSKSFIRVLVKSTDASCPLTSLCAVDDSVAREWRNHGVRGHLNGDFQVYQTSAVGTLKTDIYK